MKKLLSGNEAIAQGAYEFGVHFAAAYPGTPSTEILENIAQYKVIQAQWSPNEKVALEVGIGASLAGARTICAMKHVGVNVAADPVFTLSYTGVKGGFILVSGDDPGMHSSQNEQDNRHYARFAKFPCLEPSDSQEAKDFVGIGLEISEKFDTPVLLRMTTRTCHSKSVVECGERTEVPIKGYKKDFHKYVVLPSNARVRHHIVEERTKKLIEFNESFEKNIMEIKDPHIGIITSGISYQYAKEVLPEASYLKLAMPWPLPEKLIREFALKVKKVLIIEELEPFLEDQIKAMGIKVSGKDKTGLEGEFSPERIEKAFCTVPKIKEEPLPAVPPRPPVLCAGCPHRGVYYIFNRMKLSVTGDIGCYTLGGLPPLSAMDTCTCMGASVGVALGIEKAMGKQFSKKLIATIGDSTFIHSGITPLIDIVYNKGITTVCILDNGTTAMTGLQDHPATGRTLMGEKTEKLDLEKLCRGIGVKHVRKIDPYNLKEIKKVVKEELNRAEPSVIITTGTCMLIRRKEFGVPYQVDPEICIKCGMCRKLGCPAIEVDAEGHSKIVSILCPACGLCASVCPKEAISQPK